MKIGITGLAASGKGTTSRLLAQRLGYHYADVGLLFRALALSTKGNTLRMYSLNENIRFQWNGIRMQISLDGKILTTEVLSAPDISDRTSCLASDPAWFKKAAQITNSMIGQQKNLVADGRNIGTLVLPDADAIFDIQANLSVRVERRLVDLNRYGLNISREDVRVQIENRDRRDYRRRYAPARLNPKSVVIDNSLLSPEECVDMIYRHIRV